MILQERGNLSEWAMAFLERDGPLPWEQQGGTLDRDAARLVEVQAEVRCCLLCLHFICLQD